MGPATIRAVACAVFLHGAMCAEGLADLSGPVALLLDADKPLPSKALESLKSEMSRLFASSAVRLSWHEQAEVRPGFEAEGIVVVRFRGECRIPAIPLPPDERGPLAWTHVSDGAVLPFSEVSCERVTRAAQSALRGGERARRDELLGRALGRVVAHELVHILSNKKAHQAHGIFRRGLTPEELIADLPPGDAGGRGVSGHGIRPAF